MDVNRRKFLKITLIGGTAFLVGKVIGPLFSKFINASSDSSASSARNIPVTFNVVEDKKGLSIYDNFGEEIFQIDNKA